jgi:hypothetical protein
MRRGVRRRGVIIDRVNGGWWIRAAALAAGFAAGADAALAAAATERTTVVARVPNATAVAGHGGRVVWSRYSPRTERFALMTRYRGRTARVDVRETRSAFDVDLGPGPSGATVAVYSRCRTEPGFVPSRGFAEPRGCDLYLYDFGKRRERRLGAVSTEAESEYHPSVWRNRVAFARSRDRARTRREVVGAVVVDRLDGRGRARELRGTIGELSESTAAVQATDISGDHVAFSWATFLEGCRPGDQPLPSGLKYEQKELWVGHADGTRTLVEKGGCGGPVYELGAPQLSGDQLFYIARTPRERVRRYRPSSRAYGEHSERLGLLSYLEFPATAWATRGARSWIQRMPPLRFVPSQPYPNGSTVGPAAGTTLPDAASS